MRDLDKQREPLNYLQWLANLWLSLFKPQWLCLKLHMWVQRCGKRQTCFFINVSLLCKVYELGLRWRDPLASISWWDLSHLYNTHTRHTSAANKKGGAWIINCWQLIINPITHWGCKYYLPPNDSCSTGKKEYPPVMYVIALEKKVNLSCKLMKLNVLLELFSL